MNTDGYDYCKIFVSGADLLVLTDELAKALGGRFDHRVMSIGALTVEVRPNPDGSHPLLSGDDFVGWPTLVEIDTDSVELGRAIVDTTARVLHVLWASGYRAVAACDFEDELPWAGGMQRPGQVGSS